MLITHLCLGSSRVFSLWLEGEPLEGMDWACPSWGRWGACPLGLCPCSPVIPVVSFGEEVAFPTVAHEVLWLVLRLWSAWGGVPTMSALLPSIWGRGLVLPACKWMPALPALFLGWGLVLPAWERAFALPALLPRWGDKHYLSGPEHLHCLHSFPGGGTNAFCLGTNTTCLGLSACTPSRTVDTNTACLGLSAWAVCTPSWLGGTNTACLGLMLPAWDYVPALPAFIPGWEGPLAGPALLPSWGGLGCMTKLYFLPFVEIH